MLELTENAAEVVTAIVSQTELPETAGMRITSEDGEIGANGSAPTRDIRLSVVEAPQGDDQLSPESRSSSSPAGPPRCSTTRCSTRRSTTTSSSSASSVEATDGPDTGDDAPSAPARSPLESASRRGVEQSGSSPGS